ncbi:MAG: hypothetical protein L3K06_07760, partial [Thermoplasmata archaeon]|nr:hypothetical protein [Thermoplasmata archaeon]
ARSRAARDAARHPPSTVDRHASVAHWERLLYEREFPRHLPGRFLSVTGEGSPMEIAWAIRERLERFGPLPSATPEEADRLLRLFEGTGSAGRPELRDPNP